MVQPAIVVKKERVKRGGRKRGGFTVKIKERVKRGGRRRGGRLWLMGPIDRLETNRGPYVAIVVSKPTWAIRHRRPTSTHGAWPVTSVEPPIGDSESVLDSPIGPYQLLGRR